MSFSNGVRRRPLGAVAGLWLAVCLALAAAAQPASGSSPAGACAEAVAEAETATAVPAARRWFRDAVVYGVIPRDLEPRGARGVMARLDDLQRLGVGAIYLSPINRTVPGDFGYAVTDYFALRPAFGTVADLRRLVEAAHRRGIRVLMDFVPDHTSDRHPFFVDAKRRGAASPYYHYYERDARGRPTHYFDWSNLPTLDYDTPAVRRMILRAFAYWVRAADVDGFRIDAAWGVEERRPGFWRELRAEMDRIKPSVVLVAEASARDHAYLGEGFDAAYDWTDTLGEWAWAGVFDGSGPVAPRLDAALRAGWTARGGTSGAEGREGSGDPGAVFRFLNNNDTGARFVTRHGTGLTRAAAGLLLTLPGVPMVYLGDEVGAAFRPYRDGARAISWADPAHLRAHYRRLIEVRDRLPALRSSRWQPLRFDPKASWYAYLRLDPGCGPPVLVAVNFAGKAVTARIELPPPWDARAPPAALTDLMTGTRVRVQKAPRPHDPGRGGGRRPIRRQPGRFDLRLPPYAVRILTGLPPESGRH